MKTIMAAAALALVLSGNVLAQERAAGQAYDAQVNWAALSAKLDAIDSQNKAIAASVTTLQGSVNGINTKLDAIAACGAQGKVWTGSGCATTAANAPVCSMVAAGTPDRIKGCPAGTVRIVTSAGASYGRTGGGSSNAGDVFQGVSTTSACYKIVCQ